MNIKMLLLGIFIYVLMAVGIAACVVGISNGHESAWMAIIGIFSFGMPISGYLVYHGLKITAKDIKFNVRKIE